MRSRRFPSLTFRAGCKSSAPHVIATGVTTGSKLSNDLITAVEVTCRCHVLRSARHFRDPAHSGRPSIRSHRIQKPLQIHFIIIFYPLSLNSHLFFSFQSDSPTSRKSRNCRTRRTWNILSALDDLIGKEMFLESYGEVLSVNLGISKWKILKEATECF